MEQALRKKRRERRKVLIFDSFIYTIDLTYSPGSAPASVTTAGPSVLRLSDKPVTLNLSLNKALGNTKPVPASVGAI